MCPSGKKHWPSWPQFLLMVALPLFFTFFGPTNSRDVKLLDCSCPRAFQPVCGSDQQTYDSRCFLECAGRYDQELKIAYEGVCCPKAELCADYFDPVCDQMGNFYENDCIFDFHKCVHRRTSGRMLRIQGRGEQMCGTAKRSAAVAGVRLGQMPGGQGTTTPCDFFCEEIVSPVCDSQGRTHKNRCKFDLTSCRLRSRGIVSALHIVRDGACRKEENNFGHFPNANSMRRMSLANLMEGIRRDRARKRPSLPRGGEQEGRQRKEQEKREEEEKKREEEEKKREEEENKREEEEEKKGRSDGTLVERGREQISDIPPSKLFRDQQKGGEGEGMAPLGDRWQLAQLQTEGPPPSMPEMIPSRSPSTSTKPKQHREEQQPAGTSGGGDCPSPSACPDILDPLCDTYNLTHPNECQFSVARCEFAKSASGSDRPPRIAYRGKCTKIGARSHRPAMECDFCRDEGDIGQIVPVCDNTNLTHQSVCLFAQWNCDKRLRGVEEHVLVHIGECSNVSPIFELKDEVCPAKCSRHFKPVCDSNGLTHPNLCTYQMHGCHQRKAGRPFGWLISLRECANQTEEAREGAMVPKPREATTTISIECPIEPNCWGEEASAGDDGPICDNQGRVHKNACLFAHAHCQAAKEGKALRIVEDQQCAQLTMRGRGPKEGEGKEEEEKKGDGGGRSARERECERKWPNCAASHADPYCGSDFVTYANFCAIEKAQCLDNRLEILFKGQCELCLAEPCTPPNPMADDSHFVCDQNGETKSKCEFEMLRCIYEAKFGYNITAAYEGKCCPSAEACHGEGGGDGGQKEGGPPVCDSLGRKHQNGCFFKMAKCREEKIGKKQNGGGLEERYCGADGEMPAGTMAGGGEKEAKQEETPKMQIAEAYGGGGGGGGGTIGIATVAPLKNVSAELLSVKEVICSDRYEPVCGSDGRTYRNGCHLERRNGTQRDGGIGGGPAMVRVHYQGECCPRAEECGPEYAPVCDNERNTHLNLCEFGRQRCLAERIRSHNLTIVSYALCPSLHCPSEKCASRYEPVCATNGRTYANLCELDKSVCVLRSGLGRSRREHNNGSRGEEEEDGGGTLALDYIGECCETAVDCAGGGGIHSGGGMPICDNLARIYANQCAFLRAACLAKKREGHTLRPVQCQMMPRTRHRRRGK